MKKLILSSLLIAATVIAASSQDIRFGLTAGATFASQKVKSGGISITSDSKVGFTVGALADIPVATQFIFQPGLNFTQKGSKFSISQNGEGIEAEQTLSYIEVPLNFLYQANAGAGKFLAGAGPSFGFGIGGKAKTKITVGGQTTEESSDVRFGNNANSDDYKPLEFGGNILAGYEFSKGFFVAANYNFGLNNIAASGNSENTIKNSYFGIKVGYKFGGSKTSK